MMQKVVNLFGGPGVGKSTAAAFIFAELKMRGISCELVNEFAKDKTWENNSVVLENQIYIFGKQYHKMRRCEGKVDIIITDSPLLLPLCYGDNSAYEKEFEDLVLKIFHSYNNWNFLLKKHPSIVYDPQGRNQDEKEAAKKHDEIESLLGKHDIGVTWAYSTAEELMRTVAMISQNYNK